MGNEDMQQCECAVESCTYHKADELCGRSGYFTYRHPEIKVEVVVCDECEETYQVLGYKKVEDMIPIEGLSEDVAKELLPEGLILLGYRGSVAHGMKTKSTDPDSIDDIDLMGIYVAPIEHYLGFGHRDVHGKVIDVHERFINEWDSVSYELRKYIGLLLNQNPNVLSLLWLPDRHILFESPLGQRLREAKHLFVSRKAYLSFTGYANGQFKRMTHMNQAAIDEMATVETALIEAGIDPKKPADQNTRQQNVPWKGGFIFAAELLAVLESLRKQYFSGGYMGEKRRELVRRVGYDAKNAAHLIRLLRMGIEFLKTGELIVERPDAQELLEIKRGEWSLERVKAEAERLFALAREAYDHSSLPAEPDRQAAEQLCMEIIKDFHGLA